ncbi:MAG: glycosyltransferase family 4 protein [Candidatus Falkowbacteria bacterium]
MRVIFIGQKGIPAISGGVERHVEDLAVRLVELGHEVIVYTRRNYTDQNLATYKGIHLISLPNIPTKHLDAISHTFLACLDSLRRKPDVVHFHSIGPSFLLWIVKLLNPRVTVISTFHTMCYHHQKWSPFARWSLRLGERVCCQLSDATIAISKSLTGYVKQKYGRTAHYLPNGVNVSRTDNSDQLKSFNLEPRGYFLTVSRLVKHKGLQYAIEAFKRIDTDMKLVIVGDGAYTDDYVKHLHRMARKDSRIIFTGALSGEPLQQLYSHAYAFIQPSESEGLSISLLEAMAYERPVLVSDIPENLEALPKGEYVFKQKSILDLRAKMEWMLKNSGLIKNSGQANRKHVLSEYSWNDIAAGVVKVYKQTITAKKKQPTFFPRLKVVGKMMHLLF